MIGYGEAARYARALQALTGDDEIVPPGLTLESDRPEYALLKREFLWSFSAQIGAAVGKVSAVQLKVTGGSQRLVVVQGILLDNPATGGYRLVRNATRLAAGVGAQLRDLRTPASLTAALAFVVDNATFAAAPTTGVLEQVNVPAGIAGQDQLFVTGPWIVADGAIALDQLTVFGDTANAALNVVAWGYERFARPEELAAL